VTSAIRKHLGDFLAIVALFLIGLGIAGYILSNQRLRFPFVEEKPFTVKVELANAQAVQPGQGQTIRTAGVEVGQIGKVELEDGIAVVEMQLKPEYDEGFVREDASALLRTKTGLKDMFVELDPGEGRPLKEGGRVQLANTAPDIDPDEVLAALDADTRAYLQLLVSGAGKGLKGHGNDLRETFRRFGPLHRDLNRVTAAIAERRGNLKRLIHNYSELVEELGGKDKDLTRLVRASNAVFDSFAAEDQNISRFVAKLPGSLRQTKVTLGKVDRLGRRLGPALESLRPPFRKLDEANAAVLPFVREAAPIIRDEIRPFTRIAVPYFRDLGEGAEGLAEAGPDLTGTFRGLNRLFNIAAHNPNGAEGLTADLAKDRARDEGYLYWLAWTAQNTVSLFSTSDAQGPFRRIFVGGLNCNTVAAEAEGSPLEALGDTLADTLGAAGLCSPSGVFP
jgi:phospholipid/cholesterol/gamma-HCH transport system substrate-binding protein